uniref:Uncharacterized protein n=1 Tax=Rhizophagus irregularis (strain DAOM 181602 / DAOM 197198 / MUCL 43194) TaxID=747089 RepID=U9T7Q3_RHIID
MASGFFPIRSLLTSPEFLRNLLAKLCRSAVLKQIFPFGMSSKLARSKGITTSVM